MKKIITIMFILSLGLFVLNGCASDVEEEMPPPPDENLLIKPPDLQGEGLEETQEVQEETSFDSQGIPPPDEDSPPPPEEEMPLPPDIDFEGPGQEPPPPEELT